jgi:hypothetical protein
MITKQTELIFIAIKTNLAPQKTAFGGYNNPFGNNGAAILASVKHFCTQLIDKLHPTNKNSAVIYLMVNGKMKKVNPYQPQAQFENWAWPF